MLSEIDIQRIHQMYAAGKSTREIAAEIGCSDVCARRHRTKEIFEIYKSKRIEYVDKHRGHLREYIREYMRRRYNSDPEFKKKILANTHRWIDKKRVK